jgi:uncharacterized membrane protein YGL010W
MKTPTIKNVRLIDRYFDMYAEGHQNEINKLIIGISVPLIVFSLLGLVWSIPFPHIKFLGNFNGMFNWASFLIAFAVYYYYKLSPVLSYFMLVIIMFFCYLITLLMKWEENDRPHLWQSCLVILSISCISYAVGQKIEGKKTSFSDNLKFLLIGQIWLLHLVLYRFKVKY